MKRLFVLYIIMGMIYFTLEGLWRGWTHIIMFFIGGLCGVLVGLINEKFNFSVRIQSIIGLVIVLIIEFISGYIFNIKLGLNLWNYSNVFGNILGQICLPYSMLWFFLIPFGIWLDDWLRYQFYNEKEPDNLKNIYLKIFK